MEKTSLLGCYLSYPSLMADATQEQENEAMKMGDSFRRILWAEGGLDSVLKPILYEEYGTNLHLILLQFFIGPFDFERNRLRKIEGYRKKEKSISLTFIIEKEFFSLSDDGRKAFIRESVLSRLSELPSIIKKKKLDTDFERLYNDITNALSAW